MTMQHDHTLDGNATLSPSDDAAVAMDRMYRYQRHIYDATRKYYLLGRDMLLQAMSVSPGQRVLEVGCGTGRNILKLAKLHPELHIDGIDASDHMLLSAHAKLTGLPATTRDRITLRQGLAQQLDAKTMFGSDEPWDHIYFSYALSMIPPWSESLAAAITQVKPGGCIHIVDFYDQADLPKWFAAMLKQWLAWFGVHFRPELVTHLEELALQGSVKLELRPIRRRYAMLATLHIP